MIYPAMDSRQAGIARSYKEEVKSASKVNLNCTRSLPGFH